MKTRTLAAIGAAGLVAAALATPATAGTAPGSGFAGSGHDATSRQGTNITSGACTECHTPHQAKTTNLLWNHTLSSSNFSWSGTNATTAGTTYATFSGQTYSGMSAKCLSCHDGTVAVAQGSWFKATLQPNGTSYVGQGFLTSPWSLIGGYNTGDAGTGNVRPTAGVGTNGHGHMEGTHPLAMPYPFGQAKNSYNGSTTGNGYIATEWVADPTQFGIRLYNDPDNTGTQITAGPVATKTGMECGSCHDVHNGIQTMDDYLVRGKLVGNGGPPGTNTDNYICTKCHAK